MKPRLQGLGALLMAAVFIGLVVGSFSLSFFETGFPTSTVIYTVMLDLGFSPYGTSIPQTTSDLTESAANPPGQQAAAPTGSITTAQMPNEDCYAPATWVKVIVETGDTLQSLSSRVNADISQLQFANCLGVSTEIKVGQALLLPRLPESTATPTPLPPSPTPTQTEAPAADILSPTSAFLPSSTSTPSFEIIIVP